MDMLGCVLLCLVFTCVFLFSLYSISNTSKLSNSRRLPPGPISFLIIDNLLELDNKYHKSLANLAKIHGPFMSLKLGQVTTIVISSASMAKQVLQYHDMSFCNRFVPDAIRAHQHHDFSLAWLPASTSWKNLRKICNSHIFSGQKLDASQDLRRKKVEQLLAYVQESCVAGKAIDIGQVTSDTIFNLLSNTMFSIDVADPYSNTSIEFKKLVWNFMLEAGKPNMCDYFPLLRKIDPQGIRRRMTIHMGKMLDLFDDIIVQRLKHRKVHGSTKTNNDMLDILLNISDDNSEDRMDTNGIKHLFVDLFVAATDTTSSTLEWAMTELLHNPEVLSKARLELEKTIGRGNPIQESDISKLPYLQAIVKETFRMYPAFPFVRRTAIEDKEICGFVVPNGAQVMINLWAINRDASIWDNPNSFMPERFLGSDVDFKGQNFELAPFGSGRRICIGLPLAIRMIYLMLGSLIHSFDWRLEDGVTTENMDMEELLCLTLQKAQPLRAFPIAI